MSDSKTKNSLLSCPGDTIQEHIDFIGMSQAELAERMGRSVPKLNDLIKGKTPLTKETALKLEYVLGIDASFWMNLEQIYQKELLEIQQQAFLEQCHEWLKDFPLNVLKKGGFLSKTTDKNQLTKELLTFFRVPSPNAWEKMYQSQSMAFKIDLTCTNHPKSISAWLRMGEIQAENLAIHSFDKKKLTSSIQRLQEIMYTEPENWLGLLQEECARFGVALVYTPSIPKAPVYGVSRWVKNKTLPLIQLTDRRKDYNAFWFSFFHELAHIRYHKKSEIFFSGLDEIKQDDLKEKEADEFAAKMLLTENERAVIFSYPSYDKELVLELSQKLAKHPSIIVSQLQRKFEFLYKQKDLNELKTKVEFI